MRYVLLLVILFLLAGISTSWPNIEIPIKPDQLFFAAGPATIEQRNEVRSAPF